MTDETRKLMQAAQEARGKCRTGQMGYDEARAICQKYVDHINKLGPAIAKEHGGKFRKVSVTAFLR
jgi:hypothetical protein